MYIDYRFPVISFQFNIYEINIFHSDNIEVLIETAKRFNLFKFCQASMLPTEEQTTENVSWVKAVQLNCEKVRHMCVCVCVCRELLYKCQAKREREGTEASERARERESSSTCICICIAYLWALAVLFAYHKIEWENGGKVVSERQLKENTNRKQEKTVERGR